jgi:hypothetical protein
MKITINQLISDDDNHNDIAQHCRPAPAIVILPCALLTRMGSTALSGEIGRYAFAVAL